MPRLVSLTIIAGLVEGKLTRTVVFPKTNHQLVCIVELAEQTTKLTDTELLDLLCAYISTLLYVIVEN